MIFSTQRKRGHHACIVLMVALLALMPTYTALAEIYATPIVEPTPTPVIAPGSSKGSETPKDSTVTSDATPESQSDGMISPTSVSPGTVSLSDCEQRPAGLTIIPGGSVTITCELEFSVLEGLLQRAHVQRPDLTQTYFDAAIDIDAGLLSGLTIDPLARGDAKNDATVALSLAGLGLEKVEVEITVWADSNAPPGTSLDVSFSVCKVTWLFSPPATCSRFDDGFVTVTLEVALVEGTHYSFGCSPTELSYERFLPEQSALCSLKMLPLVGSSQVRIESILGPMSIGGWDISIDAPTSLPFVLSARQHFEFFVYLVPVSCIAASQNPSVDIQVRLRTFVAGEAKSQFDSSSSPVSASLTVPPPVIGTTITPSVSTPFVQYSMTKPKSGEAEFRIDLDINGCGVWTLSVIVDPFTKQSDAEYDGQVPELNSAEHNSEDIPLASITSGIELDSGSDPGVGSVREHTINLEYTIPANTPVGTYTSTITVTTEAAP